MTKEKTILIAEDEPIAAENLKEILEANEYCVLDIVARGKDAIEQAIRLEPEIIFMDINLKDSISGCEAAIKIKQVIQTEIIFLTAYTDHEMFEYARLSHATHYLVKPYIESQILATLMMLSHSPNNPSTKMDSIVFLDDGFSYNLQTETLFKDDNIIKLSAKSKVLFSLLCQSPKQAVSYEQINHHIWGRQKNIMILRALIYRIRSKLGSDLFENISGSGYKIRSST